MADWIWESENTVRNHAIAELTRGGHWHLVGVEVDLLGRRADALLGHYDEVLQERTLIVVEVKRGEARAEALAQLYAYVGRLKIMACRLGWMLPGSGGLVVLGVLAARSFSRDVVDAVAAMGTLDIDLHEVGCAEGDGGAQMIAFANLAESAKPERCAALREVVEASGAWKGWPNG